MNDVVKKALVILLVVVVVVTGLPVLMGMSGMTACRDCGPALLVGACTLAVLAAGAAVALVLLALRLTRRRDSIPLLLHSFLLERPPRLA